MTSTAGALGLLFFPLPTTLTVVPLRLNIHTRLNIYTLLQRAFLYHQSSSTSPTCWNQCRTLRSSD
jgi:hypothetical protein